MNFKQVLKIKFNGSFYPFLSPFRINHLDKTSKVYNFYIDFSLWIYFLKKFLYIKYSSVQDTVKFLTIFLKLSSEN